MEEEGEESGEEEDAEEERKLNGRREEEKADHRIILVGKHLRGHRVQEVEE